jgi:hypothetical protein
VPRFSATLLGPSWWWVVASGYGRRTLAGSSRDPRPTQGKPQQQGSHFRLRTQLFRLVATVGTRRRWPASEVRAPLPARDSKAHTGAHVLADGLLWVPEGKPSD